MITMNTGKAYPRANDYLVTTDGRVYRIRFKNRNSDFLYNAPREVSRRLSDTGYWVVSIMIDGIQKTMACHRMVLETYVGPCPVGRQCAHLNGKRDDCRLENLKWVTPAENMAHQRIHGTSLVGQKNHNAVFDDFVALTIKMMRKSGVQTKDIAALFGVTKNCVQKIVSGVNRANLKDPACVLALLRAKGVEV